ncbi:MAG TPA: 4Fe-4S ferredoxin [Nitrospiraceae bacterium]|nr:4Fe-4S ferredoxin [Nitrospiraceae bacterium]
MMSFRSWRWVAAWLQALVIIGLPFVRIHGQSALRFDVPSLRFYFFGSSFWISEAYFFLLILLLFFIGVMLVTVLYGRIWCGWACPQTTLSDFARLIDNFSRFMAGRGRKALSFMLSQAFLLIFSCFVAATLIWYFVTPYDMISEAFAFSLGPWTFGTWLFFSVLIYLNLAFVRQKFCAFVCPYARLQSTFFDEKTLTISFDPSREDECRGCEACVEACPAGIDIRAGLQVECINCAQCIDACAEKVKRFEKRSLIGYVFGLGREKDQQVSRPRVVWLSLVFALMAVLFVYQIAARVPLDFWVSNETMRMAGRDTSPGKLINRFSLRVENRSLKPATYKLRVSGLRDAELLMSANPFIIPADSSEDLSVYIVLKKQYSEKETAALWFTLEDVHNPELRITRETRFVLPLKKNNHR